MRKKHILLIVILLLSFVVGVRADKEEYIKIDKDYVINTNDSWYYYTPSDANLLKVDDDYLYNVYRDYKDGNFYYSIKRYNHDLEYVDSTDFFFNNNYGYDDYYIYNLNSKSFKIFNYSGELIYEKELDEYYDKVVPGNNGHCYLYNNYDYLFAIYDGKDIKEYRLDKRLGFALDFLSEEGKEITFISNFNSFKYIINLEDSTVITMENVDNYSKKLFDNNKYSYYYADDNVVVKDGETVINEFAGDDLRDITCTDYYCLVFYEFKTLVYDIELKEELQSMTYRKSLYTSNLKVYDNVIYSFETRESGSYVTEVNERKYIPNIIEKEKEIYLNDTASIEEILGVNLNDCKVSIADESIAKIENGTIKPLKVGETIIEIENDNHYYVVNLKILDIESSTNDKDFINPKTEDMIILSIIIMLVSIGLYIVSRKLKNELK